MQLIITQEYVRLVQTGYAWAVVHRYGMDQSAGKEVPMPMGIAEALPPRRKAMGHVIQSEALEPEEKTLYAQIVGSLLYLFIATRPDLGVPMSILSSGLKAPTALHMKAARHVLKYLRRTAGLGLQFSRNRTAPGCNVMVVSTDASHGDCKEFRSRSGGVCQMNGSFIEWWCKIQADTALSTMEAGVTSMTTGATITVTLRRLLSQARFPQTEPTVMYQDNRAALLWAQGETLHTKSRHMGVKNYRTRQMSAEGKLRFVAQGTNMMLADIETKVLPPVTFHPHNRKLLGMDMTDVEEEK